MLCDIFLVSLHVLNHFEYMKKLILILSCITLLLCGCSTSKKINYFQDAELINDGQSYPVEDITIKAGDKLYIMVKAQGSQEINNMFSMMNNTYSSNVTSSSNSVYGYTVDSNGYIDFPVLGKIKIGGLKRSEVEELIKNQIIERKQAKDVAVTCTTMNLYFSILGDVKNPGRYTIDRDNMSIIDAVSLAGDLNITGKRGNVLVMRQMNDKQKVYTVDLTSARQTMSSPVYYIHQGDIIYVEPNDMKARQSTINGNTILSTSFWISIASLCASLATLLIK